LPLRYFMSQTLANAVSTAAVDSDAMCCHWGLLVPPQALHISLPSMFLVDIQISFRCPLIRVLHLPWCRGSSFIFPFLFFFCLFVLRDIICLKVYSLVTFPIHGLWLYFLYLMVLLKILLFSIIITCTRCTTSISADSYETVAHLQPLLLLTSILRPAILLLILSPPLLFCALLH